MSNKAKAIGAAALVGMSATADAGSQENTDAIDSGEGTVEMNQDPRIQVVEEQGFLYGGESDEMLHELTPLFVQEQIDRIMAHPLTEVMSGGEVTVKSVMAEPGGTAFVTLSADGQDIAVNLSRFTSTENGQVSIKPPAVGGSLIIELENNGIIKFSQPN